MGKRWAKYINTLQRNATKNAYITKIQKCNAMQICPVRRNQDDQELAVAVSAAPSFSWSHYGSAGRRYLNRA